MASFGQSHSQSQNSGQIKINYKEFAQAIGYTNNYYFNLFQPLRKLTRKYGLIEHKPWSKFLTLKYAFSEDYIIIPDAYWDYGFSQKLSFPAKYMFLISLAQAQKSSHNPYWFRSNFDLSEIYHIAERSVTKGISELEEENILEVYRHKPEGRGLASDKPEGNGLASFGQSHSQSHKPEEPGEFEERQANDYRLNKKQKGDVSIF